MHLMQHQFPVNDGRHFDHNQVQQQHQQQQQQQQHQPSHDDRLEFAVDTALSQPSSLGSNTATPTTTATAPLASSSQTTPSATKKRYDSFSSSSPEISFNTAVNDSTISTTAVADTSNVMDQTMTSMNTLNEANTAAASPTTDNLTDILHLSKQFVFVYFQFMTTVQSLNVNVSLPTTSFDVLVDVIGTADKKMGTSSSPDQDANIKAHITSSLTFSIAELRKVIDSLREVIKATHASLSLFSLRTAFFSLFSMLVELSNIGHSVIFLSTTSSKKQRSKSYDMLMNMNTIGSGTNTGTGTSTTTSGLGHVRTNSQSLKLKSADTASSKSAFNGISPAQHQRIDRHDSDVNKSDARDMEAVDGSASASSAAVEAADLATGTTTATPMNDEDESLFKLIDHTIQSAQTVYSEMNNAIAKSAVSMTPVNMTDEPQSAETKENTADVASKIKELTTQCLTSMDQTKRLKACLNMLENAYQNQLTDVELNKNVYEQTNVFLKSIICILAATKSAIDVIPALNEVRSSLSILTRASKELTIKLESSTLKQYVINNTPSSTVLIDQPKLSSIPSVSNFTTHNAASNQGQSQLHNLQIQGMDYDTDPISLARKPSMLKKIPEQDEYLPTSLASISAKTVSGVGPAPKRHNNKMHLDINPMHLDQEAMMKSPLAVTTPLIASIGPAVASAVLPAKSPMKLVSNVSGTFTSANSSALNTYSQSHDHGPVGGSNNIDEAMLRHEINGSSTPSYYMNTHFTNVAHGSGQSQHQEQNSSMDMEYNPFENLISKD